MTTPMFQRRHYEFVADKIASYYAGCNREDMLVTASWIADMFAIDNPKFDRERFINAVKGED